MSQLGLIFPDFVVQGVIKEALQNFSDNPSYIDTLFSSFEDPHFADLYGAKEIADIKKYLKTNKIQVVTSWRMIDTSMPCYSIQLLANEEMEGEAYLDDFSEEQYLDSAGVEVNKEPGLLTYPPVIPASSSKQDVYGVPIRESILIGCHAPDEPNIARYMAWLLVYILRRAKYTFIERGLNRITTSFSDFNRANEFMPENIFTRFCTLSCVHYLYFADTDLELVASGINVTVKGQMDGTHAGADPANATFITIEEL